MLAVKIKLNPMKEQYALLNEMFWKWASICNHIADGATKDDLRPTDSSNGIQFSSTQLNQAETDIKDIKRAMAEGAKMKFSMLHSEENRVKNIEEMLRDETKREYDPKKRSLFKPKIYSEMGLLKTKCRTIKCWEKQTKESKKKIEKIKKTIERIEKGNVRFKPKRISLHPNSIKYNFANSTILLKPFSKEGGGIKEMDVPIITQPEQPLRGSSNRSKIYLHDSIKNFLAFAIDSELFGLNRAEEMLLKAKNPEKIKKRDEKISKKKEKLNEKLKGLSKLLGRDLSEDEISCVNDEVLRFFRDIQSFRRSSRYLELLSGWSEELMNKDGSITLGKYPILIRKPINRYSHKRLKNLKPEQYEYFIQLSYEPLLYGKEEIEERTVLGIDRGITHLLAVAILDPNENKFIYNRLIKNPLKTWKNRRHILMSSIRNLERRIRAQKNVHLPEKQMRKRIRSIENKVENYLHNVSKDIVELALKNNSTIVMERLVGMRQHGRKKSKRLKQLNYVLGLFDYAKIAKFIRYKAKKAGIPVYEINPVGTSQNCAWCLLKGNEAKSYTRQANKKIGVCSIHGQIDADLNAARTIAVCYRNRLYEPMRVS